jgi:hypothetical protein
VRSTSAGSESLCVMLKDIHILLQAANNLVIISVAVNTYTWTIQYNITNNMTHTSAEQK